jgi:hypothetical protein
MSAIAASRPSKRSPDRPLSLGAVLHSPAVATTLLGAIVTAFGWFAGPRAAARSKRNPVVGERRRYRPLVPGDGRRSFVRGVNWQALAQVRTLKRARRIGGPTTRSAPHSRPEMPPSQETLSLRPEA